MNPKVIPPNLFPNETSLRGYIILPYSTLRAAFGEPQSGGYKISTQWYLEFEDGTYATIYDWKETNLYHSELETVESFRNRPRYCWHVGGLPGTNPTRLLVQFFSEEPDLEFEELYS